MGEMRHLWAQNWDFHYSQNLLIRFFWICSWLLCPKWGNGVFLGSKLIFNFSQNEIIRFSLNCTKWKLLKKNFMAPFLWMGLNCLKARVTSRGSLLFTTTFPEISGTYFTNLGRMKGWVNLGATQWFWTRDPWIGNPVPYR